jgi:hypothetical protein
MAICFATLANSVLARGGLGGRTLIAIASIGLRFALGILAISAILPRANEAPSIQFAPAASDNGRAESSSFEEAISEGPDRSNRDIAKELGVSHNTVEKVRAGQNAHNAQNDQSDPQAAFVNCSS